MLELENIIEAFREENNYSNVAVGILLHLLHYRYFIAAASDIHADEAFASLKAEYLSVLERYNLIGGGAGDRVMS